MITTIKLINTCITICSFVYECVFMFTDVLGKYTTLKFTCGNLIPNMMVLEGGAFGW